MLVRGRSIAEASPRWMWMAAIANGILCLIGIAAAGYVYRAFPHLDVDKHSSQFSNSTEFYIFLYPALQIVIFLAPAIRSLRWEKAQRRSIKREAIQKAKNPEMQRQDSVRIYNVACGLIVAIEVCLLGLTLHRSFALATNSL